MRSGAPDEVLSGSAGWEARVWSWLGPRLLHDQPIPLMAGSRVAADVTAEVPQRVRLRVPRHADGVDWYPGDDPLHPLARYGQELQISVVVTAALVSEGTSEWETRLGRFLIVDWSEAADGSIAVEAVGRLRRLADDQLTAPTQPGPGATLASEARRLLPAGMSVAIDPALVDRPCPAGMSWSGSRLAAVQEIADAWPARLGTDEWGQLVLAAPLPDVPSPVLTLKQGERGTVVSALRSDTREGSVNRVVATSSAPGAEGVSAVADVTSGPMAVTGDYGVVTRRWSSPLIESGEQALASARTILARSVLPTRRLPVTCAPDPRIDLDDALVVRHGDLELVRERAAGPVLLRNEAFNPGPQPGTVTGWPIGGTGGQRTAVTDEGAPAIEFASISAGNAYLWAAQNVPSVPGVGRWVAAGVDVKALTADAAARARLFVRTQLGNVNVDSSYGVTGGLPVGSYRRMVTAIRQTAASDNVDVIVWPTATPALGALLRARRLVVAYADTEAAARAAVAVAFDGGTRLPDGRRGRWTGTPGASASELLGPSVVTERWEPTDRTWGYVVAYDLPLTVEDGDMRVDVGVSA